MIAILFFFFSILLWTAFFYHGTCRDTTFRYIDVAKVFALIHDLKTKDESVR